FAFFATPGSESLLKASGRVQTLGKTGPGSGLTLFLNHIAYVVEQGLDLVVRQTGCARIFQHLASQRAGQAHDTIE
ncbi:hypothetical protein, partial [Rhodovulum sulfidophilum]|uniref:hypothetical protein n=1 Tax=Rhodovulum sulfidophilum TaxID=35806 RepID=UPI001F3222F8